MGLDFCQAPNFFSLKKKNFFSKSLWNQKIVVPLHPLSLQNGALATKKKSSLKVLHKTEEVVVQEAGVYAPKLGGCGSEQIFGALLGKL